jgi:hypothetical protein
MCMRSRSHPLNLWNVFPTFFVAGKNSFTVMFHITAAACLFFVYKLLCFFFCLIEIYSSNAIFAEDMNRSASISRARERKGERERERAIKMGKLFSSEMLFVAVD